MGTRDSRDEEYIEWTPIEGGLRLNARSSNRNWKLFHTQYAFCTLTSGAADWNYRQSAFTVVPGKVYVCEPGEVHSSYRTHGPGDYSVHFFDPEWLSQVSLELGTGHEPHFKPGGLDSPHLWTSMAAVARANSGTKEDLNQRISAVLGDVLLAQAKRGRTVLPTPTLLRAREHLRERFFAKPTETIRIRDVARDLNVGYHSLVHDFSKHFGAAPYEFVGMLRRQYALQLLRRGPSEQLRSLAAIGSHAGYSDAAHLSRDLRKHFGHSPRDLAKQLNHSWGTRG